MGLEHVVKWGAYRLTSTVLDDIWPSVLLLTGVATMVQCVTVFTETNLSINSITITVLGVIVSLVVSFKTNSSYGRWWDGRNIWSNINSNSRQLAMLFWLQIPNSAPDDKKGDKKDNAKDKDDHSDTGSIKSQGKRKATNPELDHPLGTGSDHEIESAPLIKEQGSPHDPPASGSRDTDKEGKAWRESRLGKKIRGMENEEDMIKQRAEIRGLIEKKTYIGLIQAFAVSMKHALRGETGPFYSDLYPLIAFLPKYNPSSHPPINRDHLMALWHNGIPRQKSYHNDDTLAVPLTNPATFTGTAFEPLPGTANSSTTTVDSIDVERNITGITTTSTDFRKQALTSAASFTRCDNPDVCAFSRLDQKHRLNKKRSEKEFTPDGMEKVTITTVELMPPRHPPPIKAWDLFPPLRVYKMVTDYFKTQKMKEEQERAQGGKRKRPSGVKTEIPQECLMYISAWVTDLNNRNILNASFASPIMTCIMELQKALSDLDKLATTPIPSAYVFHLRMTVLLYLFFLPFQLQQYLGWVAIPATAIASTVYLGFLEIGNQIEMPFAYDQSDLDLDKYVLKIAMQLAEITAFPTAVPTSHVVLSHLNQPFLPSISLNAPTLLGMSEAKPHPTALGFAHAFPQFDFEYDSDPDDEGSPPGLKPPKIGQLPKSMREIEVALNASWQEISTDTRKFTGGHKDQLENRTGMQVAVLAL